jgi:hypothetical protein
MALYVVMHLTDHNEVISTGRSGYAGEALTASASNYAMVKLSRSQFSRLGETARTDVDVGNNPR